MEKFQDVNIPNSDFNNKAGLVSLSLQKYEGGYFLRENISGKKLLVGGFGQLAQIVAGLGTHLLEHIQRTSDKCKEGGIFTIELQVREGFPLMFNLSQGSGLLAIDNVGGWRPQNFFGQMMQQIGFLIGVGPEFLNQFPQSQEGWVSFMSHPQVANNPNLSKPIHSNFNPMMNMMGMQPNMGFGADAFSFIPTINLESKVDQSQQSKVSVTEERKANGEILLK